MTSKNKVNKQKAAHMVASNMKHKPYHRLKRLNFYTSSEREYERQETRKEVRDALEEREDSKKGSPEGNEE